MQRDNSLDVLRGSAIVLMMCDHVLAICGVPVAPVGAGWLRCTVTRLACPLFFIVAGRLWAKKCPSWQRTLQIALIAPLVTLLVGSVAGSNVDILTQYVLLAVAAPLVVTSPALALGAGAMQATWLPFDHGGYQWGYLIQFVALGALLRSTDAIPDVPLLASIGRRPLTWYLGHWCVLVGLVALSKWMGA